MRKAVFFVVGIVLAAALSAAEADGVDETLLLMEQQAESLDTLDSVIETTLQAGAQTRTMRLRLVMDKTRGTVKVQTLGPQGAVQGEILVEGNQASMRGPQAPGWTTLPMDAPTRQSLEALGVQFGAQAQGGLGGLERSDGAALATAEQADAPVAPDADPATALLQRRGFKPAQLAKARQRMQERLRRKHKVAGHQRLPKLDQAAERRRAVLASRDAKDAHRPWDRELSLVDSDSGLTMERAQFIRASRFPGGKAKAPSQARRLRQVDAALEDDLDDELVELSRTRVLKARRLRGVSLAEESETVTQTGEGPVTVRTRWIDSKVNEKIPAKEFERK